LTPFSSESVGEIDEETTVSSANDGDLKTVVLDRNEGSGWFDSGESPVGISLVKTLTLVKLSFTGLVGAPLPQKLSGSTVDVPPNVLAAVGTSEGFDEGLAANSEMIFGLPVASDEDKGVPKRFLFTISNVMLLFAGVAAAGMLN